MSSLDDALYALEPLVQQRDALALDRQSALERLLTPEQLATWQSMEQEYDARLAELTTALAALKAQIQEEVLTLGTSVKGLYWQAIHSEGRVQWDSAKLQALAQAHPALAEAIYQCRDYGKPSVRILAATRGRALAV